MKVENMDKLSAAEVVASVMAAVQSLGKNDKNTSQGFKFRGIDAVMNAVGPALRRHGGFVVPEILKADYASVPSKSGGVLNVARLEVAYSVYGEVGDPITGSVVAEAFDSGDKATAKAMSVAYRTFLLQLLCLPTDEPDPDSFTYETVKPEAPADVPALIASVMTGAELSALYERANREGWFDESMRPLFTARKAEL
jgi:hypothetical protein